MGWDWAYLVFVSADLQNSGHKFKQLKIKEKASLHLFRIRL